MAQNKQEKKENKKSKENIEHWKYEPNFVIGFDVLNFGISFFSDRKIVQGFVSSKVSKNIHAVVDIGYESNRFVKNGYDAKANGPYFKLGAFRMMVKDPENQWSGFYLEGKLGGSFYKQEYYAIPVRGYAGSNSSVAFPISSESSFWLEATLGGRIQLFDSPFYLDVNLQPKYLLFTTKQEEIQPMIVTGFGKSSTKLNMGFAWNIAYKF